VITLVADPADPAGSVKVKKVHILELGDIPGLLYFTLTERSLSVSADSITFASGGESRSFDIVSDGQWVVTGASGGALPSWITVSSASGNGNGTLTVTAAANGSVSARTGVIEIYDGCTVCGPGAPLLGAISLIQNSSAPALSVSSSSLSFDAEGETQDLTVTSNASWTSSSSETWLSVSPTSGSGNATVAVTASANTGSSSRTGTITFGGTGVADLIVTVTQDGAASLSVSSSSLSFETSGGSRTFTVTSANTSWTVGSSETWLSVSPTSGSGVTAVTATATATANTGYARTATLTVGNGSLRAVISVSQAAAPPSLSVSSASLHFATGGSTEEVFVTANRDWTAAASSPWLSLVPIGDSLLTVTASPNTGYARTDSIVVTADGLTRYIAITQDAAQQIIAEPTPPVDNRGEIEIAFEIPVNEEFGVTFTVTLPAGFLLDREATSLASGLQSSYRLSITPGSKGGWLFEITPASSLRSAGETVYREVVNIVYTTPETVKPGNYEVTLQNIDLSLTSGEKVIHQNEIKVPVAISVPSGLTSVDGSTVWYVNGILTVNTPQSERIEVYSVSGQRLYVVRKEAGKATFDLNSLPRGVLIVHGGSGWVKKIVK
jgi:hypothetical protein